MFASKKLIDFHSLVEAELIFLSASFLLVVPDFIVFRDNGWSSLAEDSIEVFSESFYDIGVKKECAHVEHLIQELLTLTVLLALIIMLMIQSALSFL